jgi:hypothetical protein
MRNQEMKIRCVEPADYDYIISTLNDWWGGRLMCDMLPSSQHSHNKGNQGGSLSEFCKRVRVEYNSLQRDDLCYPASRGGGVVRKRKQT